MHPDDKEFLITLLEFAGGVFLFTVLIPAVIFLAFI